MCRREFAIARVFECVPLGQCLKTFKLLTNHRLACAFWGKRGMNTPWTGLTDTVILTGNLDSQMSPLHVIHSLMIFTVPPCHLGNRIDTQKTLPQISWHEIPIPQKLWYADALLAYCISFLHIEILADIYVINCI